MESRWDHDWHGQKAHHLPTSADRTPPMPTSVYAATKLAQEHLLTAWAGAHDVPLSVLRLQNVYGPRQSLSNPYTGIVSLFSRLARAGERIPVYEDGAITRDFVFIDDVVAALVAGLGSIPETRRLLDVGSGERTTICDLAREVAQFHGAPEPQITGQFRDGDVRHAACSIDATTAELGWSPQWSLSAGVAGLQEWISSQED
jgi:dTDP-L-rhamnose 4-epimerase